MNKRDELALTYEQQAEIAWEKSMWGGVTLGKDYEVYKNGYFEGYQDALMDMEKRDEG